MPPTRTTALHGFSIEPARTKPVAVIDPSESSKVVGALLRFSGRGSSSADGEELTYAWSIVESPLGSTVTELTSVEDDGGVATFIPDITGQYTIGLVVSTPYRSSEQVTATAEATSVLLPLTLRTTPDGTVMFKAMSSFWRMVENNAVFSTLWSGYMQVTGSDLLRLFQADYGKSISTIQEMLQRRWLPYAPALELDSDQCVVVFGGHQGGSSAYTLSGAVATVGVLVGEREVVLRDGAPTLGAVGTELVIYTSAGANAGTYTINRLNSDSSGYLVSSSTPFPSYTDDRRVAASTLVSFSGDLEVYDSNLLTDFAALNVSAGDVLQLTEGVDAGYYKIAAVGVVGGLANNRTLRLTEAPRQTRSGRGYSVFGAVRLTAEKTLSAATDVVYLPATEADLSSFQVRELSGSGTLVSAYEIAVEPRHLLSAMVGERIYLTTGRTSARSYTITGRNSAGTGYLVGASFGASGYPAEVSYSLTSNVDISNRLLILEDEAYGIVSAEYSDGTSAEDGGRGAAWILTLTEKVAPAGREGMSWRIAATLLTQEHADLEEVGVTAGDLLVLEARRTDSGFTGEIPCYVFGARDNKLAFDIGSALPGLGTAGGLSDAEVLELATDLRVPYVYEDEADEIHITLAAEETQSLVRSLGFQTTYENIPITSSTTIDLDAFSVKLRIKKLVRNCRIPVDDALVSVPALFEFIDTPATGTNSDGETILVSTYGETTILDRAPLELIENRDYSLSSDESSTGTNLVTTADSAILYIAGGDLIDRDLRVGDYIDITSGFDQGRYYVHTVLDTEHVQALTAEGTTPTNSATGLSYTLTRRTAGNFLRFVDGMFTPEAPAPDRFWAQLSLFDNYEAIEDNFGVLVGVTKEQLDEYGSSQISYKGAVRALMFAWTRGPTLKCVTVGTHVLLGLPVTEVTGRVVDVDDTYDSENSRGRVLVEDLDADGNPSGFVRPYLYYVDDNDGLNDFFGLATNPETGAAYAVLDEVPAMTALSRGVIVEDYVTAPAWWKTGTATAGTELQKFHSWQVRVDAAQVDSRDVPLIIDFCMGIRPIYTKPTVVLVLYLDDAVEITEKLYLEGMLFFDDDPVLGVEATHMVDSYNGSSLPHRLFDYGSFSTRTLFEGVDLVTVAGSGVVTSARGGFKGTLNAPPLDHALDELIGVLPGVNSYFTDDVYYRGTPLIRAGDILFITEGNNRGRYTVVTVDSDTQLTVDELPDYPPTTRPTAEIEAGTGQVFQLQRADSHILTTGTGTVLSNAGAGDDVTSVIESTAANFRWSGVAVGDYLVITSTGGGIVPGLHEVLEVGEWQEVREDLDTKLTVRGTLNIGGTFTFYVMRDGLRANPLHEISDLALVHGSSEVTSATAGLELLHLRPGDQLEILEGMYAGQFFDILDTTSDSTFWLDFTSAVNEAAISARVIRPTILEVDQPRDEDWELEKFFLEDDLTTTIVEPMTTVVSVADLTLTIDDTDPDPENWTATATSAGTNLQVAGVAADDILDVANASANSGAFRILSVNASEITIIGLWREEEGPAVSGDFKTLNAAWDVVDDQVTLTTVITLEGVVLPGDVLEVDGVGSYVVASVSGAVLTLTRDTGVNPMASYTGRVTRRSV